MGGWVVWAVVAGLGATWLLARGRRRPRVMTHRASGVRVRELRAQGYKVKRVRLPDGSIAILRSKHPVRA